MGKVGSSRPRRKRLLVFVGLLSWLMSSCGGNSDDRGIRIVSAQGLEKDAISEILKQAPATLREQLPKSLFDPMPTVTSDGAEQFPAALSSDFQRDDPVVSKSLSGGSGGELSSSDVTAKMLVVPIETDERQRSATPPRSVERPVKPNAGGNGDGLSRREPPTEPQDPVTRELLPGTGHVEARVAVLSKPETTRDTGRVSTTKSEITVPQLSSCNGNLSKQSVVELNLIRSDQAKYRQGMNCLLAHYQAVADGAGEEKALEKLMNLPESHYDALLLITEAQVHFRHKRFEDALELAKRAELNLGRLSGDKLYSISLKAAEIQAKSHESKYQVALKLEDLERSMYFWARYASLAKERRDGVAQEIADRELKKLEILRRRIL